MVPKYDSLYVPLLHALADKKVHSNKDIAKVISAELQLSAATLAETLSSGKNMFADRVNWACTYLKKAGLIQNIKRGYYQITAEGSSLLKNLPPVLDNDFLRQYPSFVAFINPSAKIAQHPADVKPATIDTPSDMIDSAFASLNQRLADDLMTEIMSKDASFFESLVVKLLLKMGYGGSVSDAGVVTKKSNDGGIDGIIREDKLGFDKIYIQAKRWDPDTTVSRPEIHKFSGALQDNGAAKGLFITTAKFSDGAKLSAEKQHIVLVDGDRLTKLMIEYNVGVSPIATYQIKSVDSDFFSEEIE